VKNWIVTAGILACFAAPMMAADGEMTPAERAYLLEQLEQSKKDMLASIQGVTLAQWKFKPAPAVWSVAECAEHIILAEEYIFSGSQGVLKAPAGPRLETADAEHDRKLVAGVKDRSKRRRLRNRSSQPTNSPLRRTRLANLRRGAIRPSLT
jgi:DinB superfamily